MHKRAIWRPDATFHAARTVTLDDRTCGISGRTVVPSRAGGGGVPLDDPASFFSMDNTPTTHPPISLIYRTHES